MDHVDGTVDSRAKVDDPEWTAIDATIIQWFFTTISKDLFHTVVSAGDDTRAMWVKLNGLFTDNKLQCRIFLQQEFFDCHQDEQSIDDYCRRLKTLADELRDIGAKVDDDLLLSTLIAGLNEDFGNAASNLTLMPEPSFPKFVAYLRLEERRMKGVKKHVQHHALAAGTSRGAPPPAAPPAPHQQPPPRPSLLRGTSPCRPRLPPLPLPPAARWQAPRQPPRGRPQAAGHPSVDALFAAQNATPYRGYGAVPPPAPAYSAATAPAFGAAPTPAYGGFYPPQVPPPWDPTLLAALHSAPSLSSYGGGGDWYMDSGATAHMTAHPVTNLVSVRRLARENPITVEFDDMGFSVKDARTRMFVRPILALQTDNGKEFDNVAVRNLLASHGTIFRLTCPYTSQQNGRVERIIRTLNDRVRMLLFHSYVPPQFWPDALATASLLINIRPCHSRWNYTPHQLLFGAVPSYDGLRIFRCLCYPSTASTAPHKLAPQSLPCIFLGYLPNTKGYQCYDPVSHRVPSPSASPAARFAPTSTSGEPPNRTLGSALSALPALAAPVAAAPAVAPVAAAPANAAPLRPPSPPPLPQAPPRPPSPRPHPSPVPRAWYQRIAAFLQQQGFRSTRSDASLFVYYQGPATAYLLLYVDDIILTASSPVLLQQITARLGTEFALKDLGALHYFLGIKAKVSAVEGSPPSDAPFYRSIVVKRILQYIRGTTAMGLTLTASPDTSLVTYSDAD
ncbi:uncharacterized protein [Aegilops tauschii subsp. strangulata]|uniref:uncharacterized protein n=1 Tax=Aegilops tauschii subsp. strangulata TaxID=200361 RepID=UPI003CC860BB